MRCIVRIDRHGITLSPSEVNALINTAKYMGMEIDGYTVYKNIIKIRIHSDITDTLCDSLEEQMTKVIKKIISDRDVK